MGGEITQVWRKAKMLGIEFTPSLRSKRPEASLRASKRRGNLVSTRSSRRSAPQDDNLLTLLIHLKMSGQIIFLPATSNLKPNTRFIGGHPTKDMFSDLPNKSTRVIFELENSTLHPVPSTLFFNDQRKFGWIKLLSDDESRELANKVLSKLGPEPLEKNFTWQILKSKILNHKSSPIKITILDQTVVSGVGNIYACEALFHAKIDPRKKVSELSDAEVKRLREGIVSSLKDGIKYGGSTRTHFVSDEGKKGLFLDYAKVYNRLGRPCKICGTKIAKIKLGGRGTFYCPTCQNDV